MRYLFIHAHPDDETLSSGAIIAGLIAHGHQCLVLTATRGELGQSIPGSLRDGADLVMVRQAEREQALVALGAIDAGWLGQTPNRVAGHRSRIYRDSGMAPPEVGRKGTVLFRPVGTKKNRPLSSHNLCEIVDDLVAAGLAHQADALVSYDSVGGYGHPDHIRCHQATVQAAHILALPFFEIVTRKTLADQWFDLAPSSDILTQAHQSYPTQFTLNNDLITHVGGQVEPLQYAAGLHKMSGGYVGS